MKTKKQFAVIQNIPSPYRLHLFNVMWKQLAEKGIDFHVHFMSDMSRGHDERPLSWRNPKIDFPHTYWKDWGVSHYHFNPGLLCHLRNIHPDWLLIGSTFDTITGFLTSQGFTYATKCAWSEGNTKTTGQLGGWKGWVKRRAFSHCQYVGVPGRDACRYIALHQERTKKKMPNTVFLPNLVDETRFKPRWEWSESDMMDVRRNIGVGDDEMIAITPARLDSTKGLLEYLGGLTPEMLNGWRVVILGQGDLREALLKLAQERDIADNVKILDYVPYSEMPKFYAAADLFVLPSKRDPNPLSVIEALHSGLPVAVSQMAGNVDEAVTEGKNGWILPIKEPQRYSQVLQEIFCMGRPCLREMGRHSVIENAQFWNSEKAVGNFLLGVGVL